MSRRRQPADRTRGIAEDSDERKERAGDNDRETPKKSVRGLSRSTRAAPPPSVTSAAPPWSDREEEPCTNKKTPRRFSRCRPWMSINSPSNDAEQQQDIFWDPHSPTTFKLENGKKKVSANKCTVDILDIVNRIAPKDEKRSSSGAPYLGVWIGEDAIPCTPVVARDRSKMHRSRILHTEEELMKLAKQLDSNLVRQKDRNEEELTNLEDEMFSECNAVNNEDDSFLEDLPEGNDITLALKSSSQRSAQLRISQSSVDKDAEAALNALFDSSTQKYSGHLSQGLSDVSVSSGNGAPVNVRSNVHEDIGRSKKEQSCEKPERSEQSNLVSKISTNILQGVKKCSEQNTGEEKETVQPLSSSQDDFEDDWDNDLLEDDSFVMQVTQNPELIATPKDSMPRDKPDQTSAHRPGTDVKSTDISTAPSKTNNYKFVPRKLNGGSDAKPSNLCSTEITSVNPLQGSSRDTNNAKTLSGTPTRVPSRPQTNAGGQITKNNVRNLLPATNSTLIKSSQKPCTQAVPPTRAIIGNKDFISHDEWDDPKFSDEVLDMFCESDSLWEGKEDDDDLMYQVCDDIERLTQAQETGEENPKKETTQLSSSTCQMLLKPGTNASQQNKHGSHVAASSSYGSNKLNNRGVSPAAFSGNCSNTYQNGSLQKSNQTLSRSSSVPSGGGTKNTILPSTHLQNPVKFPAATSIVTNTLAPSKYSFTRIKPSPVTSGHTAESAAGKWSISNGLHPQSFGDSSNNMDPIVQSNSDSIRKLQQSSLKRHHSEPTIQSTKVFTSEDKIKKCSMEEIERKKQEALSRRKIKARACSGDIAPT